MKGEKRATTPDPSGKSVGRGVVEGDTETPEEGRKEEVVQPTDHPSRPRVEESLGGELLRRGIEKEETASAPPLQAPKKGKGVTADPPQLRGCLEGASIDEKGHFFGREGRGPPYPYNIKPLPGETYFASSNSASMTSPSLAGASAPLGAPASAPPCG